MIGLNYRDPRPIYEQLKEIIRRMILSGAIAKDGKLPSVRELAAELTVNPNTIQRAYRELESEGYLYTVTGKGSFAASLDEVDQSRKNELLQRFENVTDELLRLGVTAQTLKQKIEEAENR